MYRILYQILIWFSFAKRRVYYPFFGTDFGRPNYGQVLSQATLYLNEAYESQDFVTSNPVFRAHGIASMEQRKRRGVLGIDELLAESKGNWEELMRIAIKFPFQGGRFSSR